MLSLNKEKSDFFEMVFAVVRLIPRGKVTSYGAIASYLASPRSSRLVGWAMNASHKYSDIPAHRVLNRNGLLTGKMHFESPTKMEELLIEEGHIIQNNQLLNFEQHFWDPKEYLER
jgi:methylated-DNA-protein-cysteine methyltransferase-like protein